MKRHERTGGSWARSGRRSIGLFLAATVATGATFASGCDDSASGGAGGGAGETGSGSGSGGSGGMGMAGGAAQVDEVDLGTEAAALTVLGGFPRVIVRQGSRLLIAGTSEGDFWLTRATEDGRVDRTFGIEGEVGLAFPEGTVSGVTVDFDVAFALDVGADDILVGGAVQGLSGPFETRWGLAKLDPDGALDSTFADAGTKVIDWTTSSRLQQVRRSEAGDIYVSGWIQNSSSDNAVVRLSSAGEVDDTFSLTGAGAGAVLSDGRNEEGSVAALLDDKYVVGGGPDFAVAAVTLDGVYDESFGSEGWATPTPGALFALAEQSDGSLLLAGTETPDADSRVRALLLTKLTPEGVVDTSYGEDGVARVAYDFGSYVWPELEEEVEWEDAFVRVNGLAPLPDGGALIYADAIGFLARYPLLLRVDETGQLDTSFGQDGLVAFPVALPLLAGLSAEPAVRLVSDGTVAWLVDEVVLSEGNRGVLITVQLDEL